MEVHADAWDWVQGKTLSFDGYIGLMMSGMCHMTVFAAIEPIKKSVYVILLRYGLSHSIITEPDSKFRGQFKEAFTILKCTPSPQCQRTPGHYSCRMIQLLSQRGPLRIQ
jgi:hypothetical protein